MGLVLSHQNVEDMPDDLVAAAFGNIGTFVAFRVGSTYASKLSYNFGGEIEGTNFIKTPLFKTYTKIEPDVFTMDTLLPPDIDKGQPESIIERSSDELARKSEPMTTSKPTYYHPEPEVETDLMRYRAIQYATRSSTSCASMPDP